jgi:hypothetical protein
MAPRRKRINFLVIPSLIAATEALLTVVTLSLLIFGYPDTARITLWEEGGIMGYNSNPKLRVYFYANHQEPPGIPFIWSQR